MRLNLEAAKIAKKAVQEFKSNKTDVRCRGAGTNQPDAELISESK